MRVTGDPRLVTGIALPTPDPVNWDGMGRLEVLGLRDSLLLYMFVAIPRLTVQSPVIRLQVVPPALVYAPLTTVPYDPSGRK